MGRKVSDSALGLRKCFRRQRPSEDRISLLPDEILIRILSSLTFKEAGRTSILSKRWMHLWTYVTCLDFDASTALHKRVLEGDEEYFDSLEWEGHKYANWVNKVLNSHRALVVKKFTICCDLDDTFQEEIDGWLQYAFARKVRILEVNLLEHIYGKLASSKNYTFPSGFLGLKNCKSTGGNFSVDFKSLKTLILQCVDVSGEALESLLHNFKSLKRLVVFRSEALVNLEVSGPSLALRHLEIDSCLNMKSLSVCNANIISLKIDANLPILVLKNAQKLIDVRVFGSRNLDIVSQISSCLSKLEVLSLDVLVGDTQLGAKLAEGPELTRLKKLTISVIYGIPRWSALRLASLVRFTPNLEEFEIKLQYDDLVRRSKIPKKVVNYPLRRLKVLKLSGYFGHANELELVKFFLRNAADSLEEIIIDPRSHSHGEWPWFRRREMEMQVIGRRRAKKQLKGLVLPSRVRLTIKPLQDN